MTVVDFATGEPITEAIEKPNLLNTLRQLVARVESGDLNVENFYLIADCGTKWISFDNGMTAGDAITLLEREKFHILCVLQGIEL
jgi:hypothetical protein